MCPSVIGGFIRMAAPTIQNFHGEYSFVVKTNTNTERNIMRYRLTNEKGEEFNWNNLGYPRVLELATRFGWKPRGTTLNWWLIEKTCRRHYREEYYDRAVVSADDAAEMAQALDRAMADISEYKRTRNQDPSYSEPNKPATLYDLGTYHEDESARYDYWILFYDELVRFTRFLQSGWYKLW